VNGPGGAMSMHAKVAVPGTVGEVATGVVTVGVVAAGVVAAGVAAVGVVLVGVTVMGVAAVGEGEFVLGMLAGEDIGALPRDLSGTGLGLVAVMTGEGCELPAAPGASIPGPELEGVAVLADGLLVGLLDDLAEGEFLVGVPGDGVDVVGVVGCTDVGDGWLVVPELCDAGMGGDPDEGEVEASPDGVGSPGLDVGEMELMGVEGLGETEGDEVEGDSMGEGEPAVLKVPIGCSAQ